MNDWIGMSSYTKHLEDALEDVQTTGDKARRIEDENRKLKIALKIKEEEHACCADDLRVLAAMTSAKGATLTDVLSTHYGQNGCALSFMSDGTIKLERHGHVIITTAPAIYSAMGDVRVDNVEITG